MNGFVNESEDVPELDWEPIWLGRAVNPDANNPPNVIIIPAEENDTLWRLPVESMKVGKVYVPKGHATLSFKVVNTIYLGSSKPPRRQLRTNRAMKHV